MHTNVLVAIFCLSVSGLFAQPSDRAADRDAIRKHIDTVFNAYIHKDRDVVRATHSADWRGFLTSSRSIIRGIDQYMEAASGSLTGPGGMTGYKMVDYDVTFHGDVAIINYVAEIELKFGDQTSTGKLRVLDVYEKRNGEWTQIASNTAMHPDTIRQQIEDAKNSAKKQ